MIKASELRIGNWYNDKRINRHFVVNQIHELSISHGDTDYSPTRIDYVEGIELTPEWLERFGFESEVSKSYSSGSPGVEFMVYRNSLFTYNDVQKAWWYDGKILQLQPKYVHQLQNLFFALTGRELELKK